MAKRTGTAIRKTRHLRKKSIRKKGKVNIPQYLQTFETNQKVVLIYEPSIHEGMYHRRFYGKIGTIIGTQGECYVVAIKDNQKIKKLVVHPVHLKKLTE